MPYIKSYLRYDLEEFQRDPDDAGELNFVLSKIIDIYLGTSYGYSNLNEVIGVLECCKLELYRRIAVPYEDQKIIENGDVYQ